MAVKGGAIGRVSEVHIWNNRNNRPADLTTAPVPATLNYDLWLGPIPHRPFNPQYHPYNWRRFWAFGSGLLGDIGCHLMDVAFWALDLKHPTRIKALGDRASIRAHRRTATFTPDDYNLLQAEMGRFQRVITTPGVLSEASNLMRNDFHEEVASVLVNVFTPLVEALHPKKTMFGGVISPAGVRRCVSPRGARR